MRGPGGHDARALSKRSGLAAVEVQRAGVDAVALAGRARAVVEHVSQVGATARAPHLDAAHAVAVVRDQLHAVVGDRLPEARPPGPGFELGVRPEDGLTAAGA